LYRVGRQLEVERQEVITVEKTGREIDGMRIHVWILESGSHGAFGDLLVCVLRMGEGDLLVPPPPFQKMT